MIWLVIVVFVLGVGSFRTEVERSADNSSAHAGREESNEQFNAEPDAQNNGGADAFVCRIITFQHHRGNAARNI